MIKASELLKSDRAVYDEITSGVEITPEVHAGAVCIALANNGLSPDPAINGFERTGLKVLVEAGTVETRRHFGVMCYMTKS